MGIGHRYDPLTGKHTEDELFSSATHLLFKADEGEGAIFTQRASVMLTQLFLAARAEGCAPLPYVRHIIRMGLTGTAERLYAISPSLATQFLDVEFEDANLDDRFPPLLLGNPLRENAPSPHTDCCALFCRGRFYRRRDHGLSAFTPFG